MRYILLAWTLTLLIVAVLLRVNSAKRYVAWKRFVVLAVGLTAIVGVNALSLGLRSAAPNVSNRDIIFLVDLTLSMNAVDSREGGDTTRLDNAKEDMLKIAEANAGAAMGIYTFADEPVLYSPMTVNSTDFSDATETLFTTTYLDALPRIAKFSDSFSRLTDYLKAQHEVDPTRERIVVVMSDFEVYNNQESQNDIVGAVRGIKDYAGGAVFITYGRDEGSFVLKTWYDYEKGTYGPQYKLSSSLGFDDETIERWGFDANKYMDVFEGGEIKGVISKPDFTLTEQLAAAVGGKAVRYTDKLEDAVANAARPAAKQAADNEKSQALRQNWLYAPLALVLFLWLTVSEIIRPRALNSFFSRSRTK